MDADQGRRGDRQAAGIRFDIPDPVRTIECLIAPTQTGGIYYTGPSEDFAPGPHVVVRAEGRHRVRHLARADDRLPRGRPPGHLQVAQTVFRSELLNRWRRMFAWIPRGTARAGRSTPSGPRSTGYTTRATGWACSTASRCAPPASCSSLGFHCGFEAPAEVGGGEWTYDKAWQFLTAHANMDEAFLRFELDRHLGWPGQAPAYKIGERLWMELRDEAKRREGEAFDIKTFHRRALDIGGGWASTRCARRCSATGGVTPPRRRHALDGVQRDDIGGAAPRGVVPLALPAGPRAAKDGAGALSKVTAACASTTPNP